MRKKEKNITLLMPVGLGNYFSSLTFYCSHQRVQSHTHPSCSFPGTSGHLRSYPAPHKLQTPPMDVIFPPLQGVTSPLLWRTCDSLPVSGPIGPQTMGLVVKFFHHCSLQDRHSPKDFHSCAILTHYTLERTISQFSRKRILPREKKIIPYLIFY